MGVDGMTLLLQKGNKFKGKKGQLFPKGIPGSLGPLRCRPQKNFFVPRKLGPPPLSFQKWGKHFLLPKIYSILCNIFMQALHNNNSFIAIFLVRLKMSKQQQRTECPIANAVTKCPIAQLQMSFINANRKKFHNSRNAMPKC
jgi:hypothetical protein